MTTTTATETPRIYVASLSDYNNGTLHGTFITLDEDTTIDDVWAKINAMLATSPTFREFPEGGPAEEWALHDYEGFGPIRLGENPSLARVVDMAHAISEHGPAVAAWLAYDPSNAERLDEFEDHFVGEFESEDAAYEEWGNEFVIEPFLQSLSEFDRGQWDNAIDGHVDVASIGRSMADGLFHLVEVDGGPEVYAFRYVR